MPNKTSFSNVATTGADELTNYLLGLETGYRDAMQGLCCALGRLEAIPTPPELPQPNPAKDGVGADGTHLLMMRRIHVLHDRIDTLIESLDEDIDEWAQEEAYAERAARDAAIEEALTDKAAQAAADTITEAHESYFAH